MTLTVLQSDGHRPFATTLKDVTAVILSENGNNFYLAVQVTSGVIQDARVTEANFSELAKELGQAVPKVEKVHG